MSMVKGSVGMVLNRFCCRPSTFVKLDHASLAGVTCVVSGQEWSVATKWSLSEPSNLKLTSGG